MKKRLIILVLLIVAIIGIATLLFGERVQAPLGLENVPSENENNSTSTPVGKVESNTSESSKILTKDDVWKVWSDYLSFAKDKNIEGLTSLSFQISPSCSKPELRKECEDKMAVVFNAGVSLKKENFTKFLVDSKQAILKTGVTIKETSDSWSATQGKIIFAVNSSGKMSLLHLDPAEMWSVRKKTGSTTEEIKTRLNLFSRDSDEDGVSDYFEECVFPEDWIVFSCTKTNPNKRDSDGDGWWDGVEYFFQI